MIISTNDFNYLNTLSDYKITKNSFNKVIEYVDNNIIIGFLDYSVMYERAEINYIYVIKDFRRKHIASKLIKYMLDNIQVDSITLEVNKENIGAINLYNFFGFEQISIRKGYYNGIDGLLMIKRR